MSAELPRPQVAGRLIAGQEAERARIARELHDGVCQEIAAVAVDASYLRQRLSALSARDAEQILHSIEQRTAAIAESLRRLSHGLHPSLLHHIGLVAALQAHCAEVQRQYELQIAVIADEDVDVASRSTSLSLFRIAQEALRNSARHAHARCATVSLARTRSHLTLTVTDDGVGFDLDRMPASGGLGIVSMQERARLARGDVIIHSEPGRGTTIEARVPLGSVKASSARRMIAPPSSSRARVA
jgi:two-component system sensor histidine kinase UhpB